MSETKFTKGNFSDGTKGWKVNVLKRDDHPDWIEVIYNDDEECITDKVYELSDAHLIAAAPEMYEALLRCKIEIAAIAHISDQTKQTYELILSAIAKADGRQP